MEVFNSLLWRWHDFHTDLVSARQQRVSKKTNKSAVFMDFHLIFTSHGSGFTFPGANLGQWFPAFEHSAASISGGLRSILSGICILSAQAFTGQYFAPFNRRFNWLYSGHCPTGFQFLIDVEKLHDISTSWHSVSCISGWLRVIPMTCLKQIRVPLVGPCWHLRNHCHCLLTCGITPSLAFVPHFRWWILVWTHQYRQEPTPKWLLFCILQVCLVRQIER